MEELNLVAAMSAKRSIRFEAPDPLIDALDVKSRIEGKTRTQTLRRLIENYVGEAVVERDDREREVPIKSARQRAVFFRLNAREVALATSVAENFGSITAWAAGLVRSRLGTRAALVAESERAALVESSAQLKRVGINLNQIAHRLNRDERYQVTADDLELIREACRNVKAHSSAIDRLVYETQVRGEGGDGES